MLNLNFRKGLVILMLGAAMMTNSFADERPIVPADREVRVMFQIRSQTASSAAWSTSNAMLKGAVSESMMANEISRRYPHSDVRILSASCGKDVSVNVRFQTSRDGKSWTPGTTTLKNALTESMARNQISQRYPNTQVRILGMTPCR